MAPAIEPRNDAPTWPHVPTACMVCCCCWIWRWRAISASRAALRCGIPANASLHDRHALTLWGETFPQKRHWTTIQSWQRTHFIWPQADSSRQRLQGTAVRRCSSEYGFLQNWQMTKPAFCGPPHFLHSAWPPWGCAGGGWGWDIPGER